MDDSLDALLQQPKTVQVGAKTYALRPLTVRDVPFVSRLLRDTWSELMLRPDLLGNRDALVGWLLVRLPLVLETKVDDMLALLARQTGDSEEALGALPLDQFIELALAAVEDSLDFFTHQVIPVLTKSRLAPGAGPTFSPPSSPPGTAGPTSPATP